MDSDFRILSPTAILGYGYPMSSFTKGIDADPHLIAVDAGSTDPGPYYLGSGKAFTNRAFVKRDLKAMVLTGIKHNIPVIVGTAGGSGARPHVDWCGAILDEIACEEDLSFRLGIIYTDVDKNLVKRALDQGNILNLPFAPDLTVDAIEQSIHIVGQIGVEPIQEALRKNCDVILCGRCYDPAVFAAFPMMLGYPAGPAMHLGKILECAAIAAVPGSGADCVLGTLSNDHFVLESLNEGRKFTKESTAAHTLYEKSDPCHLPGPGGELNLENCQFIEDGTGRVMVTGSLFEKSPVYMLKLEGAAKTGFRSVCIAGTRDPVMIAQMDDILTQVKEQVISSCHTQNIKGSIFFHQYGKNGVMGNMEPVSSSTSHEMALLIETNGPTQNDADTLCSLTRSTLLHFGYENRISTAGNLAFPFSPSDTPMGETYEFSIYHLMKLPRKNLFPVLVKDVLKGR